MPQNQSTTTVTGTLIDAHSASHHPVPASHPQELEGSQAASSKSLPDDIDLECSLQYCETGALNPSPLETNVPVRAWAFVNSGIRRFEVRVSGKIIRNIDFKAASNRLRDYFDLNKAKSIQLFKLKDKDSVSFDYEEDGDRFVIALALRLGPGGGNPKNLKDRIDLSGDPVRKPQSTDCLVQDRIAGRITIRNIQSFPSSLLICPQKHCYSLWFIISC